MTMPLRMELTEKQKLYMQVLRVYCFISKDS